jgi:two-component system, response regulator
MAHKQILLVEDNPDEEILVLDALRRCGMNSQVVVVRNGADALDYLLPKKGGTDETNETRLVLLDLKLPKVGGLEVLRRLRAESRTRHMPVVVLTSSSEREDIAKSYANGANAYVRKPIDFEDFIEVIRCLERFWVFFNETP